MIRLVEALNYRCLRYVRQPLRDLQVLIGPNASGKTTFLDVVAFLGDLLEKGLDEAITQRSTDIHDLFFFKQGEHFELAVELEIPEERAKLLNHNARYRIVRYEVAIGIDGVTGEYQILDERVVLQSEISKPRVPSEEKTLFPAPSEPPKSIMYGQKNVGRNNQQTLRKVHDGNDNFYSETEARKGGGGWAPSIRLGPRKSALANMPEDEAKFPVSTWLRETLINGTQKLMLNSLALRQSSRPGQGRRFKPDGSNLPWVISSLRDDDIERCRQWVEHLQTALPDIRGVTTAEIPDTKHRFLQIRYQGGLTVPSWTVSDGTLRMLALTLPAYLPEFKGIYLIEEPENGIHPMAMETVYQALRSVYNAQILLATHSTIILGCAEPEELLCFKKDENGATDVVAGPDHPALKAWRGSMNLSDLYASGVLG
ncbi:MAG: ATP-binding protein [Phycisphaerales bacterium]|nr:ATP-binding protein [Phycisphaerales bacterium]MCB9856873.1 ATP-binding protein [Phycisphaerales bacterium]MCB9862000.1 ATP-binding protein [Phycisphaerales bacterium]